MYQATDAEGWVYGDNKWENMGAKGGLGRVSVLSSSQPNLTATPLYPISSAEAEVEY